MQDQKFKNSPRSVLPTSTHPKYNHPPTIFLTGTTPQTQPDSLCLDQTKQSTENSYSNHGRVSGSGFEKGWLWNVGLVATSCGVPLRAVTEWSGLGYEVSSVYY